MDEERSESGERAMPARRAPYLRIPASGLRFDPDDPDGKLFMLDRDFAGTVGITFNRTMDPAVPGTVTVDGEQADHLLKTVPAAPGLWILGIRLFGRLTDYGREHPVHVTGFADVDGNVMAPTDFTIATRAKTAPDPTYAEHDHIALRVAEEGLVLLENRNEALPMSGGQLNVFGSGIHSFRTSVVGAGNINPRYTVGLRDAIRYSDTFTLNEELASLYRTAGDAVPAQDVLDRARAASDVGIVVLTRAAGENMDNSSDPGEYHLTTDEDRLIGSVTTTFSRSIVVLNTPYPIDVSFVDRHGVDAVIYAGVGGMLAGPALVHVLEGSVNPSGRLPDTWPLALEDVPAHTNFYDCAGGLPRYTADHDVWIDTVYEEGIYVGYRYFSTFGVVRRIRSGTG